MGRRTPIYKSRLRCARPHSWLRRAEKNMTVQRARQDRGWTRSSQNFEHARGTFRPSVALFSCFADMNHR